MSTIIIRLQNLPLTAKAADIREFFGDLKIPKGSVNIVGGPMGDAFIGFASDEDARLAMQLDGRPLHNSSIRLMLSSKREMEQVIANAQAQAGKPPKASEMATANTQSLDQKNIKSIQQTGDISAMVPKSEGFIFVNNSNFLLKIKIWEVQKSWEKGIRGKKDLNEQFSCNFL